jgi:hypothetical protein
VNRTGYVFRHPETGKIATIKHGDGMPLLDDFATFDLKSGHAIGKHNSRHSVLIAPDVLDHAAQAFHHLLPMDTAHFKIIVIQMCAKLYDLPQMLLS